MTRATPPPRAPPRRHRRPRCPPRRPCAPPTRVMVTAITMTTATVGATAASTPAPDPPAKGGSDGRRLLSLPPVAYPGGHGRPVHVLERCHGPHGRSVQRRAAHDAQRR